MVRKAALILSLFAYSASAQNDEKPWFLQEPWLSENAPNGIDITSDGTPWIVIGPDLGNSIHSMRAEDYLLRKENYPKVWIRQWHGRSKKVAHRETKRQVSFDCKNHTYDEFFAVAYNAAGEVVWTDKRSSSEPVIPGSMAELWEQLACRPK